jgi:hypothetical protein
MPVAERFFTEKGFQQFLILPASVEITLVTEKYFEATWNFDAEIAFTRNDDLLPQGVIDEPIEPGGSHLHRDVAELGMQFTGPAVSGLDDALAHELPHDSGQSQHAGANLLGSEFA